MSGPANPLSPVAPPRGRRRLAAVRLFVVEAVLATTGALLILAAIPGVDELTGAPAASSQPSPVASDAAAGRGGLTPIMVAMGPDADCSACHLSPDGGVAVLKIPVMAHPLEGWRDCTACHADDRLVQTAPGHSSLHRSDCLVCHEAPVLSASAPARLHPLTQGQACVTCHDSHEAPLPSGMAGRDNCWICHNGAEFQGLFSSPQPSGRAASSPIPAPTAAP